LNIQEQPDFQSQTNPCSLPPSKKWANSGSYILRKLGGGRGWFTDAGVLLRGIGEVSDTEG